MLYSVLVSRLKWKPASGWYVTREKSLRVAKIELASQKLLAIRYAMIAVSRLGARRAATKQ